MSNYDQGWSDNRQFQFPRTRKELWEDIVGAFEILLLGALMLLVMFGIFGCAGHNKRLAVELPLIENPAPAIEMPATLVATVQVAQMGLDCQSQNVLLKEVVMSVFSQRSVKNPDHINIKALSGSSLCGFAQGVAEEIGTPELGARNKARAMLTIGWSKITETELKRASTVLDSLRAK